jgi:hypothetical protein
MPAGLDKENEYRRAGFSDEEIANWRAKTEREYLDAGFSGKEVDDYFGVKKPNLDPVKKVFEENLKAHNETLKEKGPNTDPTKPPKNEVDSWYEAIQAGWQMSVSGLGINQQAPSVILPEHAPRAYQILSGLGTVAGDLPFMAIGGSMGAATGVAVGAAAGPVGVAAGGLLGTGAGSFAFPTFLRESMMEAYEKGEVKDFADFFDRASSVFIETSKSALVGAATGGVGAVVGKVAKPVLSPLVSSTARVTSEVATMTTVGAALDGHLPEPDEFINGAIMVGGLHGATKVATKMRNVFAKSGVRPADVEVDAKTNVPLRAELLSTNDKIPEAYKSKPSPEIELRQPVEIKEAPKAIERSEAEQKILASIGEKSEATGEKYTADRFYTDFVNQLHPFEKAAKALRDGEVISTDKDAARLAVLADDYKAKVRHVIENGTLDYESLAKTGKGFSEIIKPHRKDLDGLRAFMTSARALEVEAAGKKSGFDVEAAREVINSGKEKYSETAKELVDFQNRNLKFLKDSGFATDKQYKAMVEMGKNYIPFKRIFESEAKGKGGKGSPLKSFKGSERDIQDPLKTMLENTEVIYKLAEQNRPVKTFVEAVKAIEDPIIEKYGADKKEWPPEVKAEYDAQIKIEKVKTPVKEVEISKEELAKFLEEQGIEIDVSDFAETLNVFRSAFKPLAENEFQVFRDGKREVWKSNDLELVKAIKALNGNAPAQNMLTKMLINTARAVTTVKKIGISLTPDFIIRNALRDQISSGVFSKGGAVPIVDTIKAIGNLIKQDEVFYNWMKSGGANGSFLEMENIINKEIYKLDSKTHFARRAWNQAKKPFDYLAIAGNIIESAPRLAEFKRVSRGATSGAKVFEGGFASKEVTVNFQRRGAQLAALNSITAFQGVAIQGLDKAVRAIKDDPKGVLYRGLTLVTAPSVYLWWANKDDERVKEINEFEKMTNWIIATDDWQDEKTYPDGTVESDDIPEGKLKDQIVRLGENGKVQINKGVIHRIPKPQELGLLMGTLPEKILDAFFKENPAVFSKLGEAIVELITPSMIPDVMSPVLEQQANKLFHFKTPLIPYHLEGYLPAEQYTEYTTESAKAMGSLLAEFPPLNKPGSLASPVVLENYIRSWSGTLGMYALQTADALLGKAGVLPDPPKPLTEFWQLPFAKAFAIKFPLSRAESITTFYDQYRENAPVLKTFEKLKKEGSPKLLSFYADNIEKMGSMVEIQEALSNMKRSIEMINKNPEFTPEEQSQQINALLYGMIETAKAGNEGYNEFKKELPSLKKEIDEELRLEAIENAKGTK